MEAGFGVHVSQGEHRRNLVTRGICHAELRGRRFCVGEAVLESDRPRPPCAYLERLTQPRLTRALGEGACLCAGHPRGASFTKAIPSSCCREARYAPFGGCPSGRRRPGLSNLRRRWEILYTMRTRDRETDMTAP
jgi:hypothetical protein